MHRAQKIKYALNKEIWLDEAILFCGSESNSVLLFVMNIDVFIWYSLYSLRIWLVGLNAHSLIIVIYFHEGWLCGGMHFFLPCLIQYSRVSVCHIRRDQKLFPEGMNEYHCHLSLSHSIRFECNLTMFGGQWIKRNLTCCFSCFYRLVNIKSFFKPDISLTFQYIS